MSQTPEKRDFSGPILLYDGGCGFCSTWVERLKRWDHRGQGTYVSQYSAEGKRILESFGLADPARSDTLILLWRSRAFYYSEAVRQFLFFLGGGWAVPARLLGLFPLAFRDRLYRWFARHRYRWFGSVESGDSCALPRRPEARDAKEVEN